MAIILIWNSVELIEIGYIYGYSDNSARIFFALHHLIVDVVSWRILVEHLNDFISKKIWA